MRFGRRDFIFWKYTAGAVQQPKKCRPVRRKPGGAMDRCSRSFKRNAAAFIGDDSRDQTPILPVHDVAAAAFIDLARECAVNILRCATACRFCETLASSGDAAFPSRAAAVGSPRAAIARPRFGRAETALARRIAAIGTLLATIDTLIGCIAGNPQRAGHHHGGHHFCQHEFLPERICL
jgi:hypothetical protein